MTQTTTPRQLTINWNGWADCCHWLLFCGQDHCDWACHWPAEASLFQPYASAPPTPGTPPPVFDIPTTAGPGGKFCCGNADGVAWLDGFDAVNVPADWLVNAGLFCWGHCTADELSYHSPVPAEYEEYASGWLGGNTEIFLGFGCHVPDDGMLAGCVPEPAWLDNLSDHGLVTCKKIQQSFNQQLLS